MWFLRGNLNPFSGLPGRRIAPSVNGRDQRRVHHRTDTANEFLQLWQLVFRPYFTPHERAEQKVGMGANAFHRFGNRSVEADDDIRTLLVLVVFQTQNDGGRVSHQKVGQPLAFTYGDGFGIAGSMGWFCR